MKILSDFNQIDKKQWGEFVRIHPKGNVFQTPEMYCCYKAAGMKPRVVAFEKGNALLAVMVSVEMQEGVGLKGRLSRRSIIMGGPLVANDDRQVLDAVLKAYDNAIDRQCIYSQIRNLNEQLNNCDTYRENGFVFEPHLDYIIMLDSEASIWNRIGKGRIKQIKKAKKNNLFVTVYQNDEISEELLTECYAVITDVYSRANLPLADIRLVREAAHHDLMVLFTIRDSDGLLLGCRMALKFRDSLYGWYAGSYSRYYRLYPNDLLIWETLRWGCTNGYRTFDYGGAGSPNKPYGVRDFKAQMGGALANYGRFEKIHRPVFYHIAVTGYNLYRKFFKFNHK